MKYALSNKDRIEATPKANGICQCCESDLIAKCGTQKIWHWAHKGKRNCDHWWENETQWHRDWKDNFPKEWQEVVHLSDDGEKHIADVKTPNGLVVPVVRNAEMMSLAQIEEKIKELAIKARDNKITLEEMQGGTFTITNGGVFGSMMSTPIINPPQSAILGMHNIVQRPIAINGKVEIHPMMYIAMSYDHRIIDGRESVGFLVKVKEMLEDPEKMLFGGREGVEVLLGL